MGERRIWADPPGEEPVEAEAGHGEAPARPDDWSDPAPPMMWPEPGSGFEASPLSPAGRHQVVWNGLRSAYDAGDWRRRALRIAVVAGLAVMLVATLVTAIQPGTP